MDARQGEIGEAPLAYRRSNQGRAARPALVVLALVLVASSVLLLVLTSGFTFYQDTWAFLMHRREFSVDAFLEPHNEHIVLIPVAIEKLLLAVFGMTTALPEYVLLILMLAATAYLLFVYVRRRLGPWPATMAATLLLFVGPAWQVLLWPFEIGFVGSVLAGLGMMLMLEREDSRGDRFACLLLAISLGFSSLGISFAAAAAVDVFQRRSSGLGRAYVAVVPLALFGVWYLGWGHTAESHLSLTNVLASPVYLMNGLASSLDTVLGLSTITVEGVGQPEWGRPLLVAAIVLVCVGQARKPGFSPRLWPVAAATASFWLLAAFNFIPGRDAISSRYAYAGAAFVLLLAADLLRGVRFGRRTLWVCGAVVLAAIAANMVSLKAGHDVLKEQSVLTRADTGAIDIARRTVDPSFALTPDVAGTPSLIDVDAAEYLPAVDEYGSPGYTPDQLEGAPELGRKQADIVLSRALPISVFTRPDAHLTVAAAGKDCVLAGGPKALNQDLQLAPGATRIELPPGPQASFSLRRFAIGEFPVLTEGAPGDSVTVLRIPRDTAPQPWHLQLASQQPARVCQ